VPAIATTRTANGAGISSRNASAIDPRSAPMLKTLAPTTRTAANHRTGRANPSLIRDISPRPLVRPSRAAVSCTAEASGSEINAVQTRSNRNVAPTCEYVPIPAGSSSAAPVTNPGPSVRKYPNPRRRRRAGWWRSLDRRLRDPSLRDVTRSCCTSVRGPARSVSSPQRRQWVDRWVAGVPLHRTDLRDRALGPFGPVLGLATGVVDQHG
jgi:hypothetical protein